MLHGQESLDAMMDPAQQNQSQDYDTPPPSSVRARPAAFASRPFQQSASPAGTKSRSAVAPDPKGPSLP
jgi:hypothetical protein